MSFFFQHKLSRNIVMFLLKRRWYTFFYSIFWEFAWKRKCKMSYKYNNTVVKINFIHSFISYWMDIYVHVPLYYFTNWWLNWTCNESNNRIFKCFCHIEHRYFMGKIVKGWGKHKISTNKSISCDCAKSEKREAYIFSFLFSQS